MGLRIDKLKINYLEKNHIKSLEYIFYSLTEKRKKI